jgi:hypothetical protein
MSDMRSSFALRITLSTYGQTVRTFPLNGGEHRRRVQVQRDGSGRKVLLQVYQGGNVSLLLLGPPEDER